jgi:hypothetical protein
MSKLFEELELKFSNLETKIENKKTFVENIFSDQQALLNERYDEESLSQKYSSEFNNSRQRWLDLISTNLRSEINHFNDLLRFNGKKTNVQTFIGELKKTKSLNFKPCLRSEYFCIRKLALKEFNFSCKFSASQLIKYKHILGIGDYMLKKANIWDTDEIKMDKALIEALEYSNPKLNFEIFRLLIEAGANLHSKDTAHQTCLMKAAYRGEFKLVEFLVENGAYINHRCELDMTAVICASKRVI